MNFLFLSRLFYPHIGGVEKHVEKISQQLIARNHHVTVITSQYDSSLKLQDTYRNINILRLPHNLADTKSQVWRWIISHRRLFSQADIIHAHDIFWWYLPLRFWLNKPIYTTFHGWEGRYPPTYKAKLSRKLAETLSRKTICVGDYITKWYGAKPDLVTYGATDQPPLLEGKPNHITVLGRLSVDNDIDLIVKAVQLLLPKYHNLKIDFLGDGELAFDAARVGNVLGFVPNPSDFIQESRWVIASSYLSILDAMAAGKKVFSVYQNPLKKDYLTLHPASKYISIHYTPASLAADLNQHLLNPDTATPSVQAAQSWAKGQTWNKLTDQYEKIWSIRHT